MPSTATSTLAAAIEASTRTPRHRVTADFHRDGSPEDISPYVASISTNQAFTSDVPSMARVVDGYATLAATVILNGDPADNDTTAALLWSPYNAASPYYGTKRMMAPATVALGMRTTAGDEFLTRFAGRVRALATNRGAAGQLTGLDDSRLMRKNVQLPLYTSVDHPSLDGRTFIDYILMQCGITPGTQDLEASLNPLVTTPWVDQKQNAWQLVQAIAKAELACAFFDTAGVFHFWNRDHFRMQSVDYDAGTVTSPGKAAQPIPVVTALRDLKKAATSEAVDAVVNDVIVPYTQYEVQPLDIIWQSNEPIRLGVRQTRVVWATLDNLAIEIQTQVRWINRGYYVAPNRSGYRACRRQDGSGDPVTNLQFSMQVFAQSVKITVTNPNSYYCYLVSPTKIPVVDTLGTPGGNYGEGVPGTAMLWIKGRAIVDKGANATTTDGGSGVQIELQDGASEAAYGTASYSHDAGAWIQKEAPARAIARYLKRSLARPMPQLQQVAVVADPRRQLGDRVELSDPGMTLSGEHAWVVGIDEQYDVPGDDLTGDGMYSQTLTLRMCAGVGSWVLGHPTRSRLGETTKLGGVY